MNKCSFSSRSRYGVHAEKGWKPGLREQLRFSPHEADFSQRLAKDPEPAGAQGPGHQRETS